MEKQKAEKYSSLEEKQKTEKIPKLGSLEFYCLLFKNLPVRGEGIQIKECCT